MLTELLLYCCVYLLFGYQHNSNSSLITNFVPWINVCRPSPERIQGLDQKHLRLEFRNKLALPLFTGSKVEGEQGLTIHVVLQHAGTGQVVTTGPEAYAKLDIVVLEGDFTAEDEDTWTREEFENFEVRERDGKRPLLTGDLTVTLKDGVGTLGELTFTDNSSWIRSRKFRLGVKVASGFCEGLRIREAKTEAFTVKDHRGERMIQTSRSSWVDYFVTQGILLCDLFMLCSLSSIDLLVQTYNLLQSLLIIGI